MKRSREMAAATASETMPFEVTDADMEDALRGSCGRYRSQRHSHFESSSSSSENEEDHSQREGGGGDDDDDSEGEDDDLEFTTRYRRTTVRRPGGTVDDSKPISFVSRSLATVDTADQENAEERQQEEVEEEESMRPQRGRRGLGSTRQHRTPAGTATGGKLDATYGIGSKLLKMMGWREGQGLGRAGEGIAEPIEVKLRPKNRGLSYRFDEKTEQQRRGLTPTQSQQLSPKDAAATALAEMRAMLGPLPEDAKLWRRGKQRRGRRPQDAIVIDEEVDESAQVEKVVDMRGPQSRVASSVAEALQQQSVDLDPGRPLRPLQYNIRLLADMAEAAVSTAERRARSDQTTLETLKAQQESLKAALDAGTSQITRLEELRAAVTMAVTPRESVHDTAALFARLKESFREEWTAYKLDELAFGTVLPLLDKSLSSWPPLIQPAADEHVAAFLKWREILSRPIDVTMENESDEELDESTDKKPQSTDSPAYSQLLIATFLPRVRQATLAWNPRDPNPMTELLTHWKPALPNAIRDNILAQLLLPRIQAEVEAWNPRVDSLPVHTWLHPWLPLVPDQRYFEPIWSAVRQKLGTMFNLAWQPGDPAGHAMLQPWKNVWDAASMDSLLSRAVLPKLTAAMHAFVVNPKNQSIDAFRWLLAWEDMLSERIIIALLEAEFFPKWTRALSEWLLAGNEADYGEITRWYLGWKSMFTERLLANARVQAHFVYALDLMNSSITGSPPPPPPPPSVLAQSVPPSVHPPTRRDMDDETLGLQDVIERLAASKGILFAPSARERDGKPIFKFGDVSISISAKVVYMFDPLSASWRPIGLQQLLDDALSGTQKTSDDPL